MKELDLYKFIEEWNCHVSWRGGDLMIWVSRYAMDEWLSLVMNMLIRRKLEGFLDSDGCFCCNLSEICNFYAIDPERILVKNNEDE